MAKKQVNKNVINNTLQPRYKIIFKGVEFELKNSVRISTLYHKIFNEKLQESNNDDEESHYKLWYVLTIHCGKFDTLTYDEFLDELDECPELPYDFSYFEMLLLQYNIEISNRMMGESHPLIMLSKEMIEKAKNL